MLSMKGFVHAQKRQGAIAACLPWLIGAMPLQTQFSISLCVPPYATNDAPPYSLILHSRALCSQIQNKTRGPQARESENVDRVSFRRVL